ncbi:hypothetical protein AOZ06_41370 [Kibdelosporangium phytohabitans]|uniref:Uncharacterized protein n=1 Tax=Kibdelosporangium phytohabitans TaxID=860235 RepID=A0A0N9IC24_9PSEU|nr:hypothetical protein AOZ06_41370 [Kibdelosporangium phytohabitans]
MIAPSAENFLAAVVPMYRSVITARDTTIPAAPATPWQIRAELCTSIDGATAHTKDNPVTRRIARSAGVSVSRRAAASQVVPSWRCSASATRPLSVMAIVCCRRSSSSRERVKNPASAKAFTGRVNDCGCRPSIAASVVIDSGPLCRRFASTDAPTLVNVSARPGCCIRRRCDTRDTDQRRACASPSSRPPLLPS